MELPKQSTRAPCAGSRPSRIQIACVKAPDTPLAADSGCVCRCSSGPSTATHRSEEAPGSQHSTRGVPRRAQLIGAATLLGLPWATSQGAAGAQQGWTPLAAVADEPDDGLQEYTSSKQQYRLRVPASWEQKDKAGADVLFEDPAHGGTSVGVTVSPVRVKTIDQFGSLEEVGRRLLASEAAKESTKGVEMVAQTSRQGAAGATLYAFEYDLDSTRGRKRILNTVTITGSKLYILNAQTKCAKEGGCESAGEAGGLLALLRQVAGSFDAGSS